MSKKYCVAICHVYYNICRVRDKSFESKMEGVFMMVRKLLKAAIYIKVIVVTTLVTMQEPMADEVMDEFVTSEIMEEETLAEDTEPFEEETNEELNMIATNEEEN